MMSDRLGISRTTTARDRGCEITELHPSTGAAPYGDLRGWGKRREAHAPALRRYVPGVRVRAAGEGRGDLRTGDQDRALCQP